MTARDSETPPPRPHQGGAGKPPAQPPVGAAHPEDAADDIDVTNAAPPDATPTPETPPGADRTAQLEEQVAALEDRVRRQQAEFANEVRQIRRKGDDALRYAAQPLLSDLLGVLDALHNAVEGLKASEHERRVADGLRLVERELLEVLRKHGVERVDAAGRLFDPQLHEAISELETDAAERTILHVLSPGFTLHGRLVRAARVVVNRPKPSEAPADGDEE